MLTTELKGMSVNERLILMEDIWNTLCHENQEIESPLWHKQVLDERKTLIDSGEAEFISIQDLRDAGKWEVIMS